MFKEQDDWASSSSSSSGSSSNSSSRSSSPAFIEDPSAQLQRKMEEQRNKKAKNGNHNKFNNQLANIKDTSSLLPSATPQPLKTLVSGFHKPGDSAFSLIAVPPEHLLQRESENFEKAQQASKASSSKAQQQNKNKNKKFSGSDAQGIGSTVWANKECRCLRCEMLRTSARWGLSSSSPSSNNNSTKNNSSTSTRLPMILVLMDADNFGFPAFAKKPPSSSLHQYVGDAGNAVFVWAFYGSNFAKAFKQQHDLEDFVRTSYRENPKYVANQNDENTKRINSAFYPKFLSTWGYLQMKKSIQCTRCEGSAQAADLVIEAVATMLVDEMKDKNIRCSLLTGDLGLRRVVQNIWSEVDDDSSGSSSSSSFVPYYIPEVKRGEDNADEIWKSILGGFNTESNSSNHRQQQRRGRE